jgi:2-methylcitrate dehydratase PrpD
MTRKQPGPLSRRRFLAGTALAAAAGATQQLAAQPLPAQAQEQSSSSPPPPITRILADWAANCSPTAVPESARKEAVRSIVNWIAAAVGGSRQPAVECALSALTPTSCTPGVRLFGRPELLDNLRAALVTGISSHVLDFDDTDLATIIHPAGPVASALFALCQTHPMSGAEFLHSFILGVEIECRIGRAIYPSHYEMGWHITGTCGTFGSAAACGRALQLDTGGMQAALGIAATEAAGLKVQFGSMSKSLNIGRASQNGMLAALLAQKGFTSAADAIEGKDGYVQAASLEHDYSPITAGLGHPFEITRNTYKPFACGIVIHPAIDAALQLRREYQLRPDDVRSIVVRANPLVLQLTGKLNPKDGLEGKFSVYHSVAVALVRGYAGPAEYTAAAVNDPAVVSVRRRIVVQTDPAVHPDETWMTIVTATGKTLDKHVEHAIGSEQRPLSDSELDEKFRNLAKEVLPATQAETLLSLAWGLPACRYAAAIPVAASTPNPQK